MSLKSLINSLALERWAQMAWYVPMDVQWNQRLEAECGRMARTSKTVRTPFPQRQEADFCQLSHELERKLQTQETKAASLTPWLWPRDHKQRVHWGWAQTSDLKKVWDKKCFQTRNLWPFDKQKQNRLFLEHFSYRQCCSEHRCYVTLRAHAGFKGAWWQ